MPIEVSKKQKLGRERESSAIVTEMKRCTAGGGELREKGERLNDLMKRLLGGGWQVVYSSNGGGEITHGVEGVGRLI